MVRDIDGRPNRSSDEDMETCWSEGFGLFVFIIIYNHKKNLTFRRNVTPLSMSFRRMLTP